MNDEIHTGALSEKRVAVIGAGPAGMAAAASLAALGIKVDWYEKEEHPGGKLNGYYKLFPGMEPSSVVLDQLADQTNNNKINRIFGHTISEINKEGSRYTIGNGKSTGNPADAVLLTAGFDFFDARLKEEFGYGVYNHVITSTDLEKMLLENPSSLRTGNSDPASIAFVHCVGSRDQQVGIPYCSRLCCITGIKQAVEMKEMFPQSKIYNFYIDVRAFGKGYEELYREAQEKHGIRFVRGRVSEAAEDSKKRIQVKAEDTLMGRPLKVTVDWLVLLVGMVPSGRPIKISELVSKEWEGKEFYGSDNPFSGHAYPGIRGVFAAGACTGPMSIPEAVASGRSAALEVFKFLESSEKD